jgi:hypothetical protein
MDVEDAEHRLAILYERRAVFGADVFGGVVVKEWASDGRLEYPQIFERFNEQIVDRFWGPEELEKLKGFLDKIGKRTEYGLTWILKEEHFVKALKNDSAILSMPYSEKGAKIIFLQLRYLSVFPFNCINAREYLTVYSLARSLIWILPFYQKWALGGASRDNKAFNDQAKEDLEMSRIRTSKDHRRLTFLSLAEGAPSTRLQARPPSLREGEIEKCPTLECWTPDLLDVLFATQPTEDLEKPVKRASREAFRKFAEEFVEETMALDHFTIPLDRFRELTMFLLSIHFDAPRSKNFNEVAKSIDESELRSAAETITKAFSQNISVKEGTNSSVGITWPMFEEGLKVAGLLFDPMYHLLDQFFNKRSTLDVSLNIAPLPGTVVPASPKSIMSTMTTPRLAQLSMMISSSTDFGQREWKKAGN